MWYFISCLLFLPRLRTCGVIIKWRKDFHCLHCRLFDKLSIFSRYPYICNAVVVVVRLYQVFVFCLDVSSSPLLPSCIACKSTFLYLSSWTNSFCALTQIFEQSSPLLYKISLQFYSRLYCDSYTLIKSSLNLMLI